MQDNAQLDNRIDSWLGRPANESLQVSKGPQANCLTHSNCGSLQCKRRLRLSYWLRIAAVVQLKLIKTHTRHTHAWRIVPTLSSTQQQRERVQLRVSCCVYALRPARPVCVCVFTCVWVCWLCMYANKLIHSHTHTHTNVLALSIQQ